MFELICELIVHGAMIYKDHNSWIFMYYHNPTHGYSCNPTMNYCDSVVGHNCEKRSCFNIKLHVDQT